MAHHRYSSNPSLPPVILTELFPKYVSPGKKIELMLTHNAPVGVRKQACVSVSAICFETEKGRLTTELYIDEYVDISRRNLFT